MHCGVVNQNATLLHHFFNLSQAQWVRHMPAHAGEHDFQRVVQKFEDLVQGASYQIVAEIKHDWDCQSRPLQQSYENTPYREKTI